MTTNIDLENAIKKRDEFLEANPHLKKNQEKIDEILDKCVESDRLQVVKVMLSASLMDLKKEFQKLKEMLPNE